MSSPEEVRAEDQPALEIAEQQAPQEAGAANLAAQRRREWALRIRDEHRLPRPLRDRLAAVVEEAAQFQNDVAGDAEPQLALSQVANVFAEAVPALLALDGPRAVAPHPAGESFFSGGRLTDDDHARIAGEQLARTGFARAA